MSEPFPYAIQKRLMSGDWHTIATCYDLAAARRFAESLFLDLHAEPYRVIETHAGTVAHHVERSDDCKLWRVERLIKGEWRAFKCDSRLNRRDAEFTREWRLEQGRAIENIRIVEDTP